jgi:glutamate racemase
MLKIGVFDSGLGGLTVVKALSKIMRNTKIFYVADTKNAPYGEKNPEQIFQYSLDITQYLIEAYNIDVLVLACNTATAFAIKKLRMLYPTLIIVGTEPGIKPAIEQTKTGKIGILATPATLKGEKYQELVNLYSQKQGIEIFEQACHGLVEQIEKGNIKTEETKILLENWLLPMKTKDVDTIVLGCTHYPLVGDVISEIMLYNANLIDTGGAIARRVLDLVVQQGYLNKGECLIYLESTGEIDAKVIFNIFEEDVTVKYTKITNK